MGDKQGMLPDYVRTVVVKDSKGLDKILLLPKALDLDRPKRSRTAFAKWQLDALERHFESNSYLVGEQRTELARKLGLSETQIKVWYQNRRTKQRKEGHKIADQEPDGHRDWTHHSFTFEPSPPPPPPSFLMMQPTGCSPVNYAAAIQARNSISQL